MSRLCSLAAATPLIVIKKDFYFFFILPFKKRKKVHFLFQGMLYVIKYSNINVCSVLK